LGYSGWKQLSDLKAIFMAAIPMAVAVYLMTDIIQAGPQIKLVIASIIGGMIYLLTCRLFCTETLNECLRIAYPSTSQVRP